MILYRKQYDFATALPKIEGDHDTTQKMFNQENRLLYMTQNTYRKS